MFFQSKNVLFSCVFFFVHLTTPFVFRLSKFNLKIKEIFIIRLLGWHCSNNGKKLKNNMILNMYAIIYENVLFRPATLLMITTIIIIIKCIMSFKGKSKLVKVVKLSLVLYYHQNSDLFLLFYWHISYWFTATYRHQIH